MEVGIDAAALDDRVSLTFTYYHRRTVNALFLVPQPPSNGFGAQLENVGELSAAGLEASLDATLLRGSWLTWDLGSTISTNHTKVLSTGGAIFYNFVPGQPAPVWRGAKVTNRDAFADPEYALDAFFGPSVPTVIINPFTTLRLPHGLLLTARGEYQGGAWGQDFPSRLVAQRGPRGPVGCDDVYKIVPWASYTGPGDPNAPAAISQVRALDRARCYKNARSDVWFMPLDFFKLREVTVQTPIPIRFIPQATSAFASLALSEAINWVAFFGGDASKEFRQGGRIHPVKLPLDPGQLSVQEIPDNAWNFAQQARWVAEDAVRRFRDVMGAQFDSYDLGAKALLYAGYANRLLGENMCEAVIDGGAPSDYKDYFRRAESALTEAISVAGAAGDARVSTAATAARASVRLMLGDDAGATSDAAAVPTDFVFQAVYSIENEDYYNFLYWVNANQPYREISVSATFYEQYYKDTGDPRVAWSTNPAVPTAEFRYVPWLFPTKYTGRESPINLSTGREMRLVEAEIALRAGDWQMAMSKINGVHTAVISDTTGGQPLAPWPATNITEAWTALKRERGIELWLEARRLGDERRWLESSTPGDMEDMSDRVRLCFPIGLDERRANPNVGPDHVDPKNPLYQGTLP